jgi:predicted dithiol-disulfide oxidoreductase (DUF899 family)
VRRRSASCSTGAPRTDFNFDLGFSHTEDQAREAVAQLRPTGLETGPETGTGLPPIVEQNARSSGTDVVGYLTESPGFSAFVRDDGAVCHTYSTTWRGLEFLMPARRVRPRATPVS